MVYIIKTQVKIVKIALIAPTKQMVIVMENQAFLVIGKIIKNNLYFCRHAIYLYYEEEKTNNI